MSLIEALKVIILGIIEGITEWLPISSTGHMLLADEFLKMDMSPAFKEMFFVVIQFGAILAVVLLFWRKMWPFRLHKKPAVRMETISIWFKVAVACVPSAVGLLIDDYLEAHFGTPMMIATMLIVYGVAFIAIERANRGKKPKIDSISAIDWKTALFIGMFQVLAMIPGTSRSGATIVGALLLGVSRTAAAEFTFFLAVPTMLAASAYKLLKFGLAFTGAEFAMLLLGMAVAFVVSIVAIKFLMGYIKRHSFEAFGWYRIVLGAIVLVYFGVQMLG